MKPAAFILLAFPVLAQPANSLPAALNEVLNSTAAQASFWGVQVFDLANERLLYSRNPGVPFIPASNTKLFSSSLALLRLGPDYHFETRVLHDAAAGELILQGGGDPLLNREALEDLADQVAESGLRLVSGDIVGDDSLYATVPYADGWTVDDTLWNYGAPVSALTYEANTLTIKVTPGLPGEPPSIAMDPPMEFYTIVNAMMTAPAEKTELIVERQPGGFVVKLSGVIRPGSRIETLKLAIHEPALYAARALEDALRRRGIVCEGRTRTRHRASDQDYRPPTGTLVAWRQSPPLIEAVRRINKESDNLAAELVLRETGRVTNGTSGLTEIKSYMAELGIPEDDVQFEDGSGLARRTLVTPRAVLAILIRMHNSLFAEAFLNTLAVPGEEGTLENRYRSVADSNALRAKTGSLSHVAALSGYVGLDPSSRLAFVIMANNHNTKSSELRAVVDKLGMAILKHGVK